jgi:glycosyltransferase involved in cell wall biosynthesis
MEKLNIVFFSLGSHDLAGNKRLKNLSKYIVQDNGVESRIIGPRWDYSKIFKLKGLRFFLFKIFYYAGNLLWFPIQIASNRKRGCKNILYFYEMENVFLHRLLLTKLFGYRIFVDIVENPNVFSRNASHFRKIRIFYSGLIYKHFFNFFISGVIVVSKFLEGKVKKDLKGKIQVFLLPVSFDPADFSFSGRGLDHVAVFYGGSFGENFDFTTFFKALATVMKENQNLKLYLTGRSEDQIIDVIKKHIPFDGRVVFLGYLPDKEYFNTICSMDIFCLPRNNSIEANSGFPFKLAEYLATGKPVIISKVSDVADYLTKDDAYIYETVNQKDLEGCFNKVLANPEMARKVGNNGKQKAEIFFNSVNQASFFTHFIRSVL